MGNSNTPPSRSGPRLFGCRQIGPGPLLSVVCVKLEISRAHKLSYFVFVARQVGCGCMRSLFFLLMGVD